MSPALPRKRTKPLEKVSPSLKGEQTKMKCPHCGSYVFKLPKTGGPLGYGSGSSPADRASSVYYCYQCDKEVKTAK